MMHSEEMYQELMMSLLSDPIKKGLFNSLVYDTVYEKHNFQLRQESCKRNHRVYKYATISVTLLRTFLKLIINSIS